MTAVMPRVIDVPPVRDEPPRRRRRTRMYVWLVLVALLAGSLVWLIGFSSYLAAKRVSVSGTSMVSQEKVKKAAKVPFGTPLARLDTAVIEREVEKISEVESAHVGVSYPSTVKITVTERKAVGYIVSGKAWMLVDRTGKQFRLVGTEPTKLPRFQLPSGTGGQAAGRAVIAVASALPPAWLAKLNAISAIDDRSVTLLLTDGRQVIWGSAERSDEKAKVLPGLLQQPGSRFDLSNPELVYAR